MIRTIFKSKEPISAAVLAHDEYFNLLRSKEYSRLDEQGQTYLDYTGGNLYAQSQLDQHFSTLRDNVLGNPHSTNPTSQLATKMVEEARQKVIEFFNAEDYYCIFTQNASGALKIIGECYPFEKNGKFLLFTDNHNSVNGIREYCNNAGGSHTYVPMIFEDLKVSTEDLQKELSTSDAENKLFAFPAQSNVSGVKHDLNWIKIAQEKGWDVLLDAAAFVPTSKLDLKVYKPDFVSISFYKIFGYPTGLGCLLVKKGSFNKLRKRWFAGGTVSFASSVSATHVLIDNHERFENGTINYLDIPALKIGLDYIESIGIERINERVNSLANHIFFQLKELKHSNGNAQLDLFGPSDRSNTGGTIIMNFKDPDGNKIPFEEIEQLANRQNISIRSGCFCNPGLDETNYCISNEEIQGYFSSSEYTNVNELVKRLFRLRGATRLSVGIATTLKDLEKFINFAKSLKDKKLN